MPINAIKYLLLLYFSFSPRILCIMHTHLMDLYLQGQTICIQSLLYIDFVFSFISNQVTTNSHNGRCRLTLRSRHQPQSLDCPQRAIWDEGSKERGPVWTVFRVSQPIFLFSSFMAEGEIRKHIPFTIHTETGRKRKIIYQPMYVC
jgi:hypothetical protein